MLSGVEADVVYVHAPDDSHLDHRAAAAATLSAARHFGAQARVRYAEAFAPARFVWDLTAVPRLPLSEQLPVAARGDRVPAW